MYDVFLNAIHSICKTQTPFASFLKLVYKHHIHNHMIGIEKKYVAKTNCIIKYVTKTNYNPNCNSYSNQYCLAFVNNLHPVMTESFHSMLLHLILLFLYEMDD